MYPPKPDLDPGETSQAVPLPAAKEAVAAAGYTSQSSQGQAPAALFFKPALIAGAAFTLLWLILINELRVEWTVNPQYSYGWIVPFLSLGLFARRWQSWQPKGPGAEAVLSARGLSPLLLALFAGCAAVLLPLRLLLEATPGWRTLTLVLALCTITLSLLSIHRVGGSEAVGHFAFPVCLILVAVPWPNTIEVPIIQGLTQANSRLVVEIMGLLGIPALQHGNVVEVSTGTVGIDEACSGIRSFQSSLMISLFLGEFYRLGLRRRLLLIPLAALAAFVFNVCRTGLLTWLAARKGIAAISQYHDEAGLTILLACTAATWAIAWLLQPRQPGSARAPGAAVTATRRRRPGLAAELRYGAAALRPLAMPLLVWLLAVESGVELWYRAHESRPANRPDWTLKWPPREPGFREESVPTVSREMLAYDEGHCGSWNSVSGVYWRMYYFRWLPGRLALSAARGHNPSVCLTAAGKQLHHLANDRCPIRVGPLVFPFRRYEFTQDGHNVEVFHCLWEEHAPGAYFNFNPYMSQLQLRLRAALQGRRNLGQRSLEFLISGIDDPQAAQAALQAELVKLIAIDQSPPSRSSASK